MLSEKVVLLKEHSEYYHELADYDSRYRNVNMMHNIIMLLIRKSGPGYIELLDKLESNVDENEANNLLNLAVYGEGRNINATTDKILFLHRFIFTYEAYIDGRIPELRVDMNNSAHVDISRIFVDVLGRLLHEQFYNSAQYELMKHTVNYNYSKL